MIHKKSVIGWPKIIFAKQCKEEKECEENVSMYINYIYVAACVAMYKQMHGN